MEKDYLQQCMQENTLISNKKVSIEISGLFSIYSPISTFFVPYYSIFGSRLVTC